MSRTLKELAVAALNYLDAPSTDAAIASGGVSYDLYIRAWRWANLALEEFGDFAPWRFLQVSIATLTLTDEDYEIDLPAAFRQMRRDPNYESSTRGRLEGVDMEDILDLRSVSTGEGVPRWYTIGYNTATLRYTIIIHPPAKGATNVKIVYSKKVTEMTVATDVPVVPEEFHRVLEMGTVAYAEERSNKITGGPERMKFEAEMARAWAKWGEPVPNRKAALRRQPRRSALVPSNTEDVTVTHS